MRGILSLFIYGPLLVYVGLWVVKMLRLIQYICTLFHNNRMPYIGIQKEGSDMVKTQINVVELANRLGITDVEGYKSEVVLYRVVQETLVCNAIRMDRALRLLCNKGVHKKESRDLLSKYRLDFKVSAYLELQKLINTLYRKPLPSKLAQ